MFGITLYSTFTTAPMRWTTKRRAVRRAVKLSALHGGKPVRLARRRNGRVTDAGSVVAYSRSI